jgi:hypothetical protein
MTAISIDTALADSNLLGAALGPLEPWATWRTVLKAAFALPLNRSERRAFAKVAGSRKPPRRQVRELWAIIGRRGGKSRIAALIASYIAAFVDHSGRLAPGEVGYVLVLAASKSQARTVFEYVRAFFEASPILRQQVEGVTTEEIRLRGNVVVAVHTSNFRTVRGRTLLAAIFDEAAYWRDETSATPDVETYRAVVPALATTGGILVGISSPYRRLGLLYAKHRDHFGQDRVDVLVVQGGTEVFNPNVDKGVIARQRVDDPAAALAEWDAQFRNDLSQFLDDASIDAAVDHGRPLELPPRQGLSYRAFVDASAGRHDAFCIGIAHQEGERVIADVIRGRKPPFDPTEVAAEFAALARQYRCHSVTGDSFAGEWVSQAFKSSGLSYTRSDLPKSAIYLEALPLFMRGAVSIPNHPQLVRELRLLERRTHRSGKDSVDHGSGGSDDFANVLCGAMRGATRKADNTVVVGRYGSPDPFRPSAPGSTSPATVVAGIGTAYPPAPSGPRIRSWIRPQTEKG